MTGDLLWGAVFLALGLGQAWGVYRSLDKGQWSSPLAGWERSDAGAVPNLRADRGAHSLGFWAGVTLDLLVMIVLVTLGAYDFVAPLVLRVLGK